MIIEEREETISIEELKSLTVAVKKRYGMDFTNYELKSLRRGFGRLITKNNLNSLLDLWGLILNDRDFFRSCIDHLTVNLTEMFRNPEVWLFLREEMKTYYAQSTHISIWHAGCSSGEEVYTMAYILYSLKYHYKTRMLATDLSTTILSKGLKGQYSPILAKKYKRNFNVAFKDEDISGIIEETENDGFRIKENIKRNITFVEHNLVNDVYPSGFDMIFCRNVMIYFDEKLKMEVLEKMHRSLKKGGYLIIGFYDVIPEAAKELFHIYDSKTRIYKKV